MSKDLLDNKLSGISERTRDTRRERRRRETDAIYDGVQFHLGVPPHIKEGEYSDENYAYYWANDDKGRIQYLTEQDDWDPVEDREANKDHRNKGGGTQLERVVGRGRDGSPIRAKLLRKHRDWYNADQANLLAKQDASRRRLRETQGDGSGSDIMTGDPRHAYIPQEIDTRMPKIRRV